MTLADEIHNCQICAARFAATATAHSPRPVAWFDRRAKILIAGQAPGARVHESGKPFTDASGDRLRDWMGISEATFSDPSRLAIVPMGFCYPGKGKSGDLPPRPECAPKWHEPILSHLTNRKLTLVIGQYAQIKYLGKKYKTLTERVKNWADAPTGYFPLPHPSPRNRLWMSKNPWFETEILPELKRQFNSALSE